MEEVRSKAQVLLDELNRVNRQEKAASALYRSALLTEQREAYEERVKALERRWNDLYDQLQALNLAWSYNGQQYALNE